MSDHDRLLASVALAQYRKCEAKVSVEDKYGSYWKSHSCQSPGTHSVACYYSPMCDNHAESSRKDGIVTEELPYAEHIRWLERKATGG